MSLAAQLSGLRQQQLDANRLTQRRPPSFIYTQKHAATVSNDDLHDLAQNAWDTLATVDPWFKNGYRGILGESAKNVDRTGLTKDENDKIDAAVNETLRALGQHALLKPAGVLVEWLVRRFRIHEFNIAGLIALYLPYHSQPQFPSALALIAETSLDGTPFASLIPARTMLAPIPLQSIVDMLPPFSSVPTSRALLDFVLRMPLAHIENGQEPHHALSVFWLQVLALYLEKVGTKLPLGEKNAVLSTLTDVLRSAKSAPDTLIASYILIARFALHYPFVGQYEVTILKALVKSAKSTEEHQVELAMLTTLFIISDLGDQLPLDDKFLGKEAWKVLTGIEDLATHLIRLNQQYDGSNFMTAFVHRLVHESRFVSKDRQALAALMGPVDDAVFLPQPIVKLCVQAMIKNLVSLDEQGKELPEAIVAIARNVYQRYPDSLEQVTKALPSSHALSRVMSNIQLGVAVPDAILASSAPDVQLRIDALTELFANQELQDGNPSFVHDTLLARLSEDDPRVLTAALDASTLPVLHAHVSGLEIVKCLDRSFDNAQANDLALEYLTGPFIAEHADLATAVAQVALKRVLTSRAPKSFGQLSQRGWLAGFKPPSTAAELAKFVAGVAKNISKSGEQQAIEALRWLTSDLDNVAALLVVPEVVKQFAQEQQRPRAVQVVYQALKGQLVAVDDAPERDIYENVWAHPKSKLTRQILRYRAVFDSLKSLPAYSQAWLGRDASSDHATLLLEVFDDLQSLPVNAQLAQALFNHDRPLIESRLSFLAFIATNADRSLEQRLFALVSIKKLIESEQARGQQSDYQLLVPALLVAMLTSESEVRRAAFECLKTVRAVSGDKVYASDGGFYASQKDVQLLGTSDVAKLVDAIVARERELLVDPSYLSTVLAQLDGGDQTVKKKASLRYKALVFFYSHVSTWQDAAARTVLIRTLDSVRDVKKYDLAFDLFVKVSTSTDPVSKDVQERYASALLSFYVQVGRKWLDADAQHLARLVACVDRRDEPGTLGAALRDQAFAVIRSNVFKATRGEARLSIMDKLVKVSLIADARIAFASRECLRSCAIDDETFVTFLSGIRTSLNVAPTPSKGSKRAKTSTAGSSDLKLDRLSELTLVLELVDFTALPVSRNVILVLFDMLASLNEIPATKGVESQYTSQLILSALSTIVSREDVRAELTADLIRVNPVLDLMRSTTNPQTSQQCLSFLAGLGPIVPDQLVQNVMPIFTFMGANVMHRDDAYSLRVVEQTIDSILPALVESVRSRSSDEAQIIKDVRETLSVFTNAANHVPRHRRTKLFTRVVSVLGAERFLAPVSTLLLRRPGKSSHPSALPLAVCEAFPVKTQLGALESVLEETASLLIGQDEMNTDQPDSAEQEQKRELEGLQLLDFFNTLISSAQLASKADAAKASDRDSIDGLFATLIKRIVEIWFLTDDDDVRDVLDGALESVGLNMSAVAFGQAIQKLFASDSRSVQLKALSLFARRLPTVKQNRRADLVPIVLVVLDYIQSVLAERSSTADVRMEAIVALQAIVQSAQKDEDAALSKVLTTLVKQVLEDDARALSEGAQVCLVAAPLCAFLGTRLIAQIANLSKMAVKVGTLGGNVERAVAALKLLDRLVAAVPAFLGANLDYMLIETAVLGSWVNEAKDDVRRVSKARSSLYGTISKKVPAKTLFAVIPRTYDTIVGNEKAPLRQDTLEHIAALFDVLQRSLRQHAPNDILPHYRTIFKFFLAGFDLRHLHDDTIDDEDVSELEGRTMSGFTQFVLKLNENAFRPIFLRTYDWAVLDLSQAEDADEDHIAARKIVLYRLFASLVETLKAIIVPYFSFMLDQTIELLEFFSRDDADNDMLWFAVVQALTATLDADDQGFWTEGRLRKVLKPVAAQLLYVSDEHTEGYHALLAALAEKLQPYEALLKDLNLTLLASTRSSVDDVEIKRTAIEAVTHLWDRLGSSLVPFVPESMPFLSEALEEIEGGVESATRKLVKKIESYLGESIGSYLET